MPTITVSDTATLYYRVHAAAAPNATTPLLLIHGAGGTHMHWPADVRRLAGATVYSLDLPGHGKSKGLGFTDIGDYADSVREFADALHLSRLVLAGHSMGGAIALEFALRYPQRAAGLVLVGTGARLRVAPQILAGLLTDFEQTTSLLATWTHQEQPDPALRQEYVRRLREIPPEIIHGDFAACDRFDRLADLGKITTPALVLCGEADRMTPVRYSQTLAEQMPHARLVIVPAAGHMVMLERPNDVAAAIDGWLNSILPLT